MAIEVYQTSLPSFLAASIKGDWDCAWREVAELRMMADRTATSIFIQLLGVRLAAAE
jgi:hypothetical protein